MKNISSLCRAKTAKKKQTRLMNIKGGDGWLSLYQRHWYCDCNRELIHKLEPQRYPEKKKKKTGVFQTFPWSLSLVFGAKVPPDINLTNRPVCPRAGFEFVCELPPLQDTKWLTSSRSCYHPFFWMLKCLFNGFCFCVLSLMWRLGLLPLPLYPTPTPPKIQRVEEWVREGGAVVQRNNRL